MRSFQTRECDWKGKRWRVLTRPSYPAAGDIGMVDYISKMISGLHWPEYAEKLDKKVYPGLAELLPMIKNIDVSGALARANPRAMLCN